MARLGRPGVGRGVSVGGLVAAAVLAACARTDPAFEVVAEVGEERITRGQLDAHLDQALGSRELATPADRERDRVYSRLLDDLVDERLLEAEARRRGVTVTDAEVEAYLADLPEVGRPDVEVSRRHLAVRKLQEAVLRAVGATEVEPGPEVEAGGNGPEDGEGPPGARLDPPGPGTAVVLRTIRVASGAEAEALRERIGKGEVSFEDEARARDPEVAVPLRVPVDRLPPEVADALAALKPGEVSAPVHVQGGIYLFALVERTGSESGTERAERERRALLRSRGERALLALLAELRRRHPVRLHGDALGFVYVAETD